MNDALALAAVADELDRAPGDGDDAEGRREIPRASPNRGRVSMNAAAPSASTANSASFPAAATAPAPFGIALTTISSANAAIAPSSHGDGTTFAVPELAARRAPR